MFCYMNDHVLGCCCCPCVPNPREEKRKEWGLGPFVRTDLHWSKPEHTDDGLLKREVLVKRISR